MAGYLMEIEIELLHIFDCSHREQYIEIYTYNIRFVLCSF